MPTETPLTPLLVKVKRADERLSALQRQLGRHGKGHPVKIATKLDFKEGWHESFVRAVELPPARFALAVGESLYHGRSVLDHLVWALVEANHGKPGRHNEFPIRARPFDATPGDSDLDTFIRVTTGAKGMLRSVCPDAVALIESLQPYNRPSDPPYFLEVLNRMAREDRHHALHQSLVAMGEPDLLSARLAVPDGVAITDWVPLFEAGTRLEAGTELVRFRLSRYGRDPKVGVDADLPVDIAFGDPPVLLDGLREVNKHLAALLRLFEQYL